MVLVLRCCGAGAVVMTRTKGGDDDGDEDKEFTEEARVVTSPGTSRFRGVSWNKACKKWKVQITASGKKKYLGVFTDELQAAHAYDAHAIENKIDTPRNFPDEDEDEVVAEAARVRAAPKKRKKAANKTSSFQGVSSSKAHKNWTAKIWVNGETKYIGYFPTEIAAARAYDAFVITKKLKKPLNFAKVILSIPLYIYSLIYHSILQYKNN